MFTNKLVVANRTLNLNLKRFYTCIVERYEKVPLVPKDEDPRRYNLKSKHYHYKLVDCLHRKKWGNVDLLLTEYVEGVGHKGEIVNVSRHVAYYELLPARLAVYPTDEYLEMFKSDREALVTKAKVSPYAMKTKEELSKIILDIPMNIDSEWTLNKDHVRIALRYSKIMSTNDSIQLDESLKIDNKNWKNYNQEPFMIKLKINEYVTADVKCRIVPIESGKLWEEFTIFNKTV